VPGLNTCLRVSGTAVLAAVLSAVGGFVAVSSWAEGDEGSYMGLFNGVRCRPSQCAVGAHSEQPARSHGRQAASSPQSITKDRAGRPTGPAVIESNGWEYDLGGGMGILPRFGGHTPKPSAHDGGVRPGPAAVERQVVRQLVLPAPVMRMSPDERHAQLVRVPTWMWLDRHRMWKPVSKTVKVPGVVVTATAAPQSATWVMGDGSTVVCEGPGTPYTAKYPADSVSPDCGHTYLRSSAGQPGEAYTVTVTVTWRVRWHGGGQQGVIPGLRTHARLPLRVAEAQALVVS
jgi:hypothetical protein